MKRSHVLSLCLTGFCILGLVYALQRATIPATRHNAPDQLRWEQFYDGGFGERDMVIKIVATPHKIVSYPRDHLLFILGETGTPDGTVITMRAVEQERGTTVWNRQFGHSLVLEPSQNVVHRGLDLAVEGELLFVLGREVSSRTEGRLGGRTENMMGWLAGLEKGTGNTAWEREIHPDMKNESVTNGAMSLTPDGDLMVSLTAYDIDTLGYRNYLLRLNGETGEIVWQKCILLGRQSPHSDSIIGKLYGNGYLISTIEGPNGYPRSCVSKLDPNTGTEQWKHVFADDASFNNYPRGFAVSGENSYLLHDGENGALITSIGRGGTAFWTVTVDSGYEVGDIPTGLLIDDRNDLFVGLTCRNNWYLPTRIDVCVAKLSIKDGKESWRTIVPVSQTKAEDSIYAHQISARMMTFDNNKDILVLGTSWNGSNLDIFNVTIDREDGRAGSLLNYDGPAADHDYFVDAELPFQEYGIVVIGATSRCASRNKPLKNIHYRMSGGKNWSDPTKDVSSFDDNDPYNYDQVVFRCF